MNTATHTPTPVTIRKCSCGHPSCRDHWLSNGKFCQGSGFDKEEAERVARACNAHDELVAALQKCESMLSDGLPIGRAQKSALVEAARAALAKAGAA